MNKFPIIFILVVCGVAFFVVTRNVTGNSVGIKTTLTNADTAWRGYLKSSGDSQLRKLAEYEDRCGEDFSGAMIFQDFPVTAASGAEMGRAMAEKMKEFAIFGIRPVVVVEPVDTASGEVLLFKNIAAGECDEGLAAYFSQMKEAGLTDRQMGLWAPLPEPNIDAWGRDNSDPEEFVAAYNRFGNIFKKYFPTADIGPLLDSETYLWDAGNTVTMPLDPYLAGIDKNLADSFGLQGFPWPYVGAGGLETDFDAASFLPAAQAIDAAKMLGTKSVWFNTGTFSSFYSDGKQIFPLAAGQRAQVLESVLQQTVLPGDAGMKVAINIFAQDKSGEEEGIDWSYRENSSDAFGADGAALCEFAKRARRAGITLSVFDIE